VQPDRVVVAHGPAFGSVPMEDFLFLHLPKGFTGIQLQIKTTEGASSQM